MTRSAVAGRTGRHDPGTETRPADRAHLLAVLGMSGEATRQELSAAYRRLVAQHHPDRFHASTREAQDDAANRFIEITRAYEELMISLRD